MTLPLSNRPMLPHTLSWITSDNQAIPLLLEDARLGRLTENELRDLLAMLTWTADRVRRQLGEAAPTEWAQASSSAPITIHSNANSPMRPTGNYFISPEIAPPGSIQINPNHFTFQLHTPQDDPEATEPEPGATITMTSGWCHSHSRNEPDLPCYRACFECGHVWPEVDDWMRDVRVCCEEQGWEPDFDLPMCPLCSHDF